ncbi:MAG: hypothetical protein ACLRPV_07040 [Lacrimispora saccharolytica]
MNRRNRSMKLKTKVIISFFITIFVPIILCGITFYLFSEYKVKAIGEQYGIENPTYEMLSNNALMLDILTHQGNTQETLRESRESMRGQIPVIWRK